MCMRPHGHYGLGRVYGNASHASTAYGTLVQFIASPWKLIIREERQLLFDDEECMCVIMARQQGFPGPR